MAGIIARMACINWADGQRFNQSRLILTASTLDQTFSRQATIVLR